MADGVWLVSSVYAAARVHTLDGLPLATRSPAGVVEALVDQAVDAAVLDGRRPFVRVEATLSE